MPKLIRTTDELPKEFRLDKYNDLDKQSAMFWHHAIQKRIILWYYLEYNLADFSSSLGFGNNINNKKTLTKREVYEIKKTAVENIFYDPFSSYLLFDFKRESGEVVEIDMYGGDNINCFKKHLPVSNFTIKELKFVNHVVGNYINKELYAEAEDEKCVKDFLTENLNFWLSPSEYPICINPFYPDNVIFDELKIKLEEIRNKIKIENRKPVERKDLISWAAYGLLPFFDLKLWEIFMDYKITRSVMAVTLYPKGQYGEDTIRKSVEPLYLEFIEGDSFDGGGFEQIDNHKKLSISDSLIRLAYAEESGKKLD
ncbi:DUF6387 family protein [Acinetobacter courvalinii]|uniref:DUF6387 family protein n=1 Tax=Acinetobacter courvalinii TaxID=280147 RepID=UPI00190036D9|nr:DUF6387 family protein [Acinetobacter courvalinii]MBJ8417466.1 hypothetical protein [Acinetobacter courvalinii]